VQIVFFITDDISFILIYYRDLKNSLSTSNEEGKIEGDKNGIEKGINIVAKNMLDKGLDISQLLTQLVYLK
jgi:predicted transposase YdaD